MVIDALERRGMAVSARDELRLLADKLALACTIKDLTKKLGELATSGRPSTDVKKQDLLLAMTDAPPTRRKTESNTTT